MKIFISYSSKYRELVERLRLALVAEGHEPFVDRVELEPGQPFDAELREAIDDCDLFVYLVSPESVAPGSYALAELQLAQARWPHPRGRVLPVRLAPTPLADVPPYLKAVTMFEPQGDAVPGIVAAIARLGPGRRRRWLLALGAVALLCAVAAGWAWREHAARVEKERQAIASAAELCASGGHAAGWSRLEQFGSVSVPDLLSAAREDCAMSWLREIRVRQDTESFTAIVNRVTPRLVEGLATARGRRAADLRAHIGWGEALRAREGAADANPDAHFRRALEDEPDNVYANAMRAHFLAVRNREEEAVVHFRTAVAADRDRPFVRRLQLGAWLWRAGYAPHVVRAVDEMRRNGEAISPEHRSALWSPIYTAWLFNADDDTRFLAILPADDHLATFDWLYPQPRQEGETAVWRYCRAMLQANAGRREAAVAELRALRDELRSRGQSGRALDQTQRALKRLAAK
jgi:tetratricopeptide (TPR) repeat protein